MASASCGRLLRYACRPTSSFAFSKLRCRSPSQALHSPRNSALLALFLSLFWRAHLACKFCTILRSPSSSFTLGKLRTLLARLAQNFLRNTPLLTLFLSRLWRAHLAADCCVTLAARLTCACLVSFTLRAPWVSQLWSLRAPYGRCCRRYCHYLHCHHPRCHRAEEVGLVCPIHLHARLDIE